MIDERHERTADEIRAMAPEKARAWYIMHWGATEAEADAMVAFSHGIVADDVRDTQQIGAGTERTAHIGEGVGEASQV